MLRRLNIPSFRKYGSPRIVVGGCDFDSNWQWRKLEDAHAHVVFDIICVKKLQHIGKKRNQRKDGSITVFEPSHLLWHELAHLLTPLDSRHGRAWRDKITELGYPNVAAKYAVTRWALPSQWGPWEVA